MKNWTWQTWVGKLLLFVVALAALLAKEFGLEIPWSTVILPAATGAAQWILAWIPGDAWQKVVGKGLLWAIGAVEVALVALAVNLPIWTILVPLLTGLAQYLISSVPGEPPPA